MKRYLLLLMALVLAGIFHTNAKEVYFETNDIDTIYIGIQREYDMTIVEWEANGTASATLNNNQGMNICLYPGYVGTSISVNDEVVQSQFSGDVYLAPSQLPDGAMVKIMTEKAEEVNVIIKGNPEQISVNYLYHTYDMSEWGDGELTIPIINKNDNVTVSTLLGYGFKSIMYNGSDQLGEDFKTFTINSMTLKGGDNVYEFETMSLADLRTSSFNVEVIGNPAEVALTLAGDLSNIITGDELLQPIRFSPEFDLPVTIQNVRDSHSIYKVEIDNTEIAPEGYAYKIYDLKDDATIKVEVDFPDVRIPVRLTFVNPETEASIQYVLGMDSHIIPPTEWQAEGWTVAMGTPVSIAFNVDDYYVSALLNGVEVDGDYVNFVALDEAGYDLEITANPRSPYLVTFNYQGLPAHFKVQLGASGDEYVEMTGEDSTTVEVPRTRKRVRIIADEGWAIADVYADNKPSDADIPVTGNMTIDVFIEEYVRALPLAIYLDPETDWTDKTLTLAQSNAFRHKELTLEPGYNVIHFNEGDLPLELGVTIDGSHDYPGFLNGEQLATPIGWFEEMTPGSVIMLYGEYPESYGVSFSVDEETNVEIYRDEIVMLENFEDQTALQGTLFTIVPENVTEVIVSVNDVQQTLNGDRYLVVADKDLEISVKKGDPLGIKDVHAESLSDVFSLQGIRVLEKATAAQIRQLPAGIYIVGGKKVTVK